MNNKFIFFSLILFLTVSCGGGGSSPYSGSSGPGQASSSLENLNPNNLCKKAWYTTTFPDPTTTDTVFNHYTFFWQANSLEDTPICINKYVATDAITSTGGISWDLYVKEITEYSKYTLGQIVPVNIFILGATPIENVTDAEKATYNADFQTVQSRVGTSYSNDLATSIFPIDSASGGYSFEAAPNGANMQLPQGLVWDKPGEYANDNVKIQGAFKVIAHEYFNVYQNSIKFYNESNKTISIPINWQSTPSIVNNPQGDPAYFPWWIEEGGADFGAIVLSAKFANTQAGIDVDTVINPVQQFRNHFIIAHQQFELDPDLKLSSFNLPPSLPGEDYAYQVGTAALLYAWYKDERNFNAAMSKYYTDWQEAEKERPGKGFEDAFYDAFWKNNTEYYTLSEFDDEFSEWIRNGDADNRWALISKTTNEIIHADVIPTTVNTPNSASKIIQVQVDSNPFGAGNRYFIDGVVKKTLVVKAGQTYKFNISNIANHPFKFSTNVDGTNNPGDEYKTNVSVNGTEVTIVIPASGISNLYYYCSIHPGMGGRIIIKDQISGGVDPGAY